MLATKEWGSRMAYVVGYKHDVFVSYAHVDDQPLPGAMDGWVCTLVDALKILLAEQLGRAEILALWRDLGMARNAPVTEQIVSAVSDAALLLVVLSEGYLKSDWCTNEYAGFLKVAGERSRRLFIVERMPIETNRKPAPFRDLVGYPFWTRRRSEEPAKTLGVPVPSPNEPEYYARLNRLAVELANELKRMQGDGLAAR
jgi:hypothetical protein